MKWSSPFVPEEVFARRIMMTDLRHRARHHSEHVARSPLQPAASDLIRVGSRRWFLQTGLAGPAGLSLPDLLRLRARGDEGRQDGKGEDGPTQGRGHGRCSLTHGKVAPGRRYSTPPGQGEQRSGSLVGRRRPAEMLAGAWLGEPEGCLGEQQPANPVILMGRSRIAGRRRR
jgi:hypothetical protein